MKCIIGKKIGMTQVFREDGAVVPVTRVQAGPCVVTQVKSNKKEGYDALQIGFGTQKLFRKNKAQSGHLKGIQSTESESTVRDLKEFRTDADHGLKRGDIFTVTIFQPGEKVMVRGVSKGKGFQGVVKRHGFAGSPATHGHKDQLRMPGSIGATDPGRVFKGTRMGGHMGDASVTVKNLEIVEIHADENELLIKGALPGARGSLLFISTPEGIIELTKQNEPSDLQENVNESTDGSEETVQETEPVHEEVAKADEVIIEQAEEPKNSDEEKKDSPESLNV